MTRRRDGGAPGEAVHDICKMCHYWMPLAIVSLQTGAQLMTKERDITHRQRQRNS